MLCDQFVMDDHVVAVGTDGHFITEFYTLTIHRSHRTVRWVRQKARTKAFEPGVLRRSTSPLICPCLTARHLLSSPCLPSPSKRSLSAPQRSPMLRKTNTAYWTGKVLFRVTQRTPRPLLALAHLDALKLPSRISKRIELVRDTTS